MQVSDGGGSGGCDRSGKDGGGDEVCKILRRYLMNCSVFPKTDASKHAPVYSTIDVATLKVSRHCMRMRARPLTGTHTAPNQVSSFTFPLEISKPFFALSSSTGVVGLLQMPDDSLEWFQATAANGKLDISHRSKTPLASYGGVSQGMVQVLRVAHLITYATPFFFWPHPSPSHAPLPPSPFCSLPAVHPRWQFARHCIHRRIDVRRRHRRAGLDNWPGGGCLYRARVVAAVHKSVCDT